jgi:hypothetical protein
MQRESDKAVSQLKSEYEDLFNSLNGEMQKKVLLIEKYSSLLQVQSAL